MGKQIRNKQSVKPWEEKQTLKVFEMSAFSKICGITRKDRRPEHIEGAIHRERHCQRLTESETGILWPCNPNGK